MNGWQKKRQKLESQGGGEQVRGGSPEFEAGGVIRGMAQFQDRFLAPGDNGSHDPTSKV